MGRAIAALLALILLGFCASRSNAVQEDEELGSTHEMGWAQDHYERGLAYANQQRYAEAEIEFIKAIVLRPDFDAAHYSLGRVRLREKMYELAEQSFRDALRIKPHDQLATAGLIMSLGGQERYEEAEALIEESLRENQDSEFIYVARADVELRRGRVQEAKKAFERALQINPQNQQVAQLLKELQESEQKKHTSRPDAPQVPSRTGGYGISPWLYGPVAYVIGATLTQFLIGLLKVVVGYLGFGAAVLPGAGLDWLISKFKGRTPERAEKWNLGFYVATWAGPVYLLTTLILMSAQLATVNVFTGLMIAWLPGLKSMFIVLGWLWIVMTIGLWGLLFYGVLAWILRVWLGALGMFWMLFGQLL